MKAFVTGSTGFIGSRVVLELIRRDYQVYGLVRSQSNADWLVGLGATPVWGDITNVKSMREAMTGSDFVFHLAGWYKLGSPDWPQAEQINVEGTRNVLELAVELGVPKIIYTSSVAVFGDTCGQTAEENFIGRHDWFLTEYHRTKWKAHYEVAIPLIEDGAPIIIVMPGVVYGPGDKSLIGDMMRLYFRGLFPVLPGPELTLTLEHVDDIARGHVLAAEKGRPGESYLLTGPALTLKQAAHLWAKISSRREPFFDIPGRFLKPFAPVMKALGSIIPIPNILSHDAIAILEATFIANSDKARGELGWEPRPPEEGMRQTYDWWVQKNRKSSNQVNLNKFLSGLDLFRRKQIASIALGAAIGLLFAWILTRRKRK